MQVIAQPSDFGVPSLELLVATPGLLLEAAHFLGQVGHVVAVVVVAGVVEAGIHEGICCFFAYLEGGWRLTNSGEWIGFGEMMDVADVVGGFRSRRWWELDEGGSSPLSLSLSWDGEGLCNMGQARRTDKGGRVRRGASGERKAVLCYAAWQTTIASRPGHCSADYLVVERRPERVGEGDTPVVECGASRSSACRILLS
jgi:hypothetical protein